MSDMPAPLQSSRLSPIRPLRHYYGLIRKMAIGTTRVEINFCGTRPAIGLQILAMVDRLRPWQ
jgi:hypothetical protein